MKSGKIKKVRLALGLTQKEFAARIGMQTSGAVCLLEKGRRTPTGPVLLLLHHLRQLAAQVGKKSSKNRKNVLTGVNKKLMKTVCEPQRAASES